MRRDAREPDPRPRPTRRSLASVAALLFLASPRARAEGASSLDITVVKTAGVPAYQEVTDQFAESCRVRARVVNLGEGPLQFRDNDVVLAVGQEALDAVAATRARVVAALALRIPPKVLAADVPPPPELSLRALKAARPSVRRVAVVFGPRTEALERRMEEPARALGIELVRVEALDGPAAVRALYRAQDAIDALWLAPDLDVLVPQVFRYALVLQLRRAIPVVAVSRQQVRSGAMLAIDTAPRDVGRQAAELVNELLAGVREEALTNAGQTGTLEIAVNREVATRLGADIEAVRRIGPVRVE